MVCPEKVGLQFWRVWRLLLQVSDPDPETPQAGWSVNVMQIGS